jgi:hypothetical protein
MNDPLNLDEIRVYLPKYLTPEKRDELFKDLNAFPNNKPFYMGSNDPSLLQGDGWVGLVVLNFHTAERRAVSGIVLSNSCDISADNPRAVPPNVVFCPLLSLDRYQSQLIAAGQRQDQVDSVVDTIRRQRVSSILYLPPTPGEKTGRIALFDDVHSHPLSEFVASERWLLFRLSQFGFYLFLFKLSLHFTRMQEDVQR